MADSVKKWTLYTTVSIYLLLCFGMVQLYRSRYTPRPSSFTDGVISSDLRSTNTENRQKTVMDFFNEIFSHFTPISFVHLNLSKARLLNAKPN